MGINVGKTETAQRPVWREPGSGRERALAEAEAEMAMEGHGTGRQLKAQNHGQDPKQVSSLCRHRG